MELTVEKPSDLNILQVPGLYKQKCNFFFSDIDA